VNEVIEKQFPEPAVPFLDRFGCLVFIVLFVVIVVMVASSK
jgi:hypothetical protein